MGIKPTAVSGARCRIKVDGEVVAFATGLSYSVTVEHAPVRVMGAYEVVANEPVAYSVNGQLQIVRYTKSPNEVSKGPGKDGNSSNALGGEATLKAGLNPANLLLSETFDIEVYDKRDGATSSDGVQFVRIRDCRLQSRQGQVASGSLGTETITFVGVFFDDDQQMVSASGPQEG